MFENAHADNYAKSSPLKCQIHVFEVCSQIKHQIDAFAILHVDAKIIRTSESLPEVLCITIVPAADFQHWTRKFICQGFDK